MTFNNRVQLLQVKLGPVPIHLGDAGSKPFHPTGQTTVHYDTWVTSFQSEVSLVSNLFIYNLKNPKISFGCFYFPLLVQEIWLTVTNIISAMFTCVLPALTVTGLGLGTSS